ncbi:PQQ-like beta-propeller repeat protein [Candidatus Pelagibacter sp.]|jgi:outer membrane protein assembly factor BamB|nr:PQQ-like beta-propeller repeat protein [Candidatus Pelagibacter sp.]
MTLKYIHRKELIETFVNNIFKYFILLIILSNCSLDTKSGIWTDKKELILEESDISQIFNNEELLNKEFNANLKIELKSKLINSGLVNNLRNNTGRINYDGVLKKISKFKFKKIKNFKNYEPELIFESDNLIFFDKKGSIIKFNSNSKKIWEKNYYKKNEIKLKPLLTLGKSSKILIVADNISKYYAINLKNGNLLWSKYNSSPFNSQIKVHNDKFFIIDFNNILRCISIKDGSELWNIKTSNTFIKSQKKLSIIIVKNILYFNNSAGDITAVDINNGSMLWQIPTQNSSIYEDTFLLKTSNIVANDEMIIFSNNRNEFYSIDVMTGSLKWKQNINSSVQPSIVNNLIFTITNEGYLTIIDGKTGNIIRITDVFHLIKKRKRNKIKPVGFVVAKENIYLTTDHGRLIVVDIKLGKTKSIIKIDNNKVSRPFILNKNLYIIKNDSIIKLD